MEPNSGLGRAISYLLKHWEKLTLFLRVAGAPLDNNICERALKKAILHRKNALFYKTCHGAHVGDIFMSSDLHVRTLRGQSLRLPHRVGSARRGTVREPTGLDALELPTDARPLRHTLLHRQLAPRQPPAAPGPTPPKIFHGCRNDTDGDGRRETRSTAPTSAQEKDLDGGQNRPAVKRKSKGKSQKVVPVVTRDPHNVAD